MADLSNEGDQEVRVLAEKNDDDTNYRELMYKLDAASDRRLLVDIGDEGEVAVAPKKYVSRIYSDFPNTSEIELEPGETMSIFKASVDASITSGQLLGFFLYLEADNGSPTEYEVKLKIDGTEVFNLDCEQMEDHKCRRNDDQGGVPFTTYVEDNDVFVYWPRLPDTFESDVEIIVKSNFSSTDMDIDAMIIHMRVPV